MLPLGVEDGRRQEPSSPRWNEIKEIHQEWKDTWFGLEFGLMGDQGAGRHPDEDMHIQWVEDAVTVAKNLGEEDGWEHSPWEALLDELIEMGAPRSRRTETRRR